MENRLNRLSVMNILLEKFRAVPGPLLFSIKDMPTIIQEIPRKVTTIWSRKGKCGNRNLMAADRGMDRMVPQSAAFDVVRFQNKPSTKMALTPGLIIPVYSWIN
jgi:hypothetical protein